MEFCQVLIFPFSKDSDNVKYCLFKDKNDDSIEVSKQKIKHRVFFTSRKTLLNEFNHFEGNMNIFQPAIDITDEALEKEREDINKYLCVHPKLVILGCYF